MAKARKYTNEQFIEAVKSSMSVRQVLGKLGLKEAGGNYRACRDRIVSLGIDATHFTGQSSNKGRSFGHKRPIEEYLIYGSTIQSYELKNRLFKEGYFQRECSCCHLSEWLTNPIPLELDHINGNNKDNNLSNLRILCPNCHALTPTYRGKNKCGGPGGIRTHR